MRLFWIVPAAAAAAMMAPPAAEAHHSFGMFDMQKMVTVTGTVKDFQWANPHVWIDLVATSQLNRQAQPWGIECDAVAIMQRKGWNRSALKPGDKVVIMVHPLKTGAIGGFLVSATANGKPIGQAVPTHY